MLVENISLVLKFSSALTLTSLQSIITFCVSNGQDAIAARSLHVEVAPLMLISSYSRSFLCMVFLSISSISLSMDVSFETKGFFSSFVVAGFLRRDMSVDCMRVCTVHHVVKSGCPY